MAVGLIAVSRGTDMTRSIRKSVGIIGLGIIGRRIADHLRHQGLSVFVWNRTPRPVPNFVGSPAELAQTCNYLQIFVSDDDALMRMIQTISMSLTPRHIVIAHPTVSPDTMREAAALVERRGARLVEAPFTGSKLATLDLTVPWIISSEFDPHFSVKHVLKDMQLANRMGRHFDLARSVAGAARYRLLDEARQGRGDDDCCSIARRFLPFVQAPD